MPEILLKKIITKLPKSVFRLLSVAFIIIVVTVSFPPSDNKVKADITTGLVGWWKMDESSWNGTSGEVIDSSGYNDNGTAVNGVTTVAGKLNRAGDFDGTNDYVQIPHNSAFNTGSEITLSTWVNMDSFPAPATYVVSRGMDVNTVGSYSIGILADGSTGLGVHTTAGLLQVYSAGGAIRLNTWSLITATFDGRYLKIYVDGVLLNTNDSGTTSSMPAITRDFYIGRHDYFLGGYEYWVNGRVDDARIYNRALTAADIYELAGGIDSGLVGHWKLDESSWNGTSGEVADSSGQGNNGTAFNGAVTTSGKLGNAGSFDGTDYVEIPDNPALDPTTTMSYGLWMRPTANNNFYYTALLKPFPGDIGGNEQFFIQRDPAGGYIVIGMKINGAMRYVDSSTTWASIQNSWTHVFVTYDGSNLKLYVNGTLEGTNAQTGIINTNNQPVGIGGHSNPNFTPFIGQIDDVRIYTRNVSSDEVSQLYSEGNSPETILPGSDNDGGYFTKVIEKPDGYPLIYYYNLTGSNDLATIISCGDINCSTSVSSDINVSQKPVGAWGLLYIKSSGNASYLSRDTALQGTLSRLDCNNADCTSSTFASEVFTKTGGYFGPVSGAVRPNGIPFMAMDGIDGMGGILDSFTCSDENCTTGTRRTLDTGGKGQNPSVAVLSDNRAVVSYYDTVNQALKIYVCANSTCSSGSSHILDSGSGNFGQVSQIIIRNDDTAGIAYSSPSGLKFYSCANSSCSSGTSYSVHEEGSGTMTGNYGGGQMMQLDTNGNPQILNIQARRRSPALSIYQCYNPNCSEGRFRTFVQNGDSNGIYASILIRGDGGYVIPFKDNTSRQAKLFDQLPTNSSELANLDGSLSVKQVSRVDPLTVQTSSNSNPQTQNFSTAVVDLRIQNGSSIPIADVTVTFNQNGDLDWSSVTGDTNASLGKSVIGNLETAPGTDPSHVLYIPRLSGNGAVRICPGATTLAQVTATCSNGYELTTVDPNVSIVTIGGNEYWKVSGLTGTGGLSLLGTTGVKDTLTRLQVSTASDHAIQFSSVNGVTASGQTIAVQFDPGAFNWDLSTITLGDIDLLISTVSVTLAGSPGVSTWGVDINTATDTITFTAPTSGSGYLPAGGQAIVLIGLNASGGTNQIVNPGVVASYEVHLLITNAGTETAEIEIPIIDDDTVNVTGYIDTFITFDIDTASTNIDCDAAGGSNPCDSYGGSVDNSGYVVDLGEMTTSTINTSGSSVAHASGGTGNINSVWFDLSSNAGGGTVVSSYSANDALQGPGGSTIPTVGSGQVEITVGSSLYGLQNRPGDIHYSASGSIQISYDCSATSADDYFCSTGGTAGRDLFSTPGSIDSARVQLRVGASPSSFNTTGTYTDQLTFIATAQF